VCFGYFVVAMLPPAGVHFGTRESRLGIDFECRERAGKRREGKVRRLGAYWRPGRRLGFGCVWGHSHGDIVSGLLRHLRRSAGIGRAPLPMADFRQVLAVFVDVLLV
jgi:hypothetical protein